MRRPFGSLGAVVVLALVLAVVPAAPRADAVGPVQNTYWVDAAVGLDTNDGLTEGAAFRTLTKACSVADAPDTIMVKPGTYDSGGGEIFPLLLQGASLVSTDGSATTTIQGDGSHQTIIVQYVQDGDVISGLTITGGGNGPGGAILVNLNWSVGEGTPLIEDNRFVSNDAKGFRGGAVSVFSTGGGTPKPLFQRNLFSGNNANTGGAISLDGAVGSTVRDNVFSANTAYNGGALGYTTSGVSHEISDNEMSSNEVTSTGGHGGAMYISCGASDVVTVTGNVIQENVCGNEGGALWVSGGNFVLERNDAGGNDAGSGGFAYALAATVTAQNNAIGGGSAANGGAAWSVFNSKLFETNDTVVENYGGLIGTYANPASTLSVVNSICWNPLLSSDIEGADAISFCCLNDTNVSDAGKGNVVGGGVVFGDPGFANLVPHSPDLGEGSICLDAADSAQAPSDDIHGAARPQHGDGDGVADADIGCAEYVDKGLPEVTHSLAYLSHATRVTLTASDTASGPKQIRYRIDGGAEQAASGASAVVTLTDLGVRQLAYRALDWAGNSSAWTTVTVPVKYTGLSFAAPSVSAFRSARVFGYLKYANASGALVPFAGRTVRIQQYKGGAWTTVKYAVTSATGSYACTVTPTSRTWYRAVYVGSTATLLSQISASRAVLPQAYLTRPTGPVSVEKGTPFTAAGFLLPRHTVGTTPVRILCYRWDGGTWAYKGGYAASVTDYSTAYSKYSARVKLPSVGYWRIRAFYPTSATNFRTYGPVRAIRVE